MGLEFQSRAFVHLKDGDVLKPAVDGNREARWFVTGRMRKFLHYCQEAKWSSYDAAKQVYESVNSLTHSFGFFSLTADYLDHDDRDRAYLLRDSVFREVNTRNILSEEDTLPGLYNHFDWCRHYCWYAKAEGHFYPFLDSDDSVWSINNYTAIAGWFFIDEEHPEFPALLNLFERRDAVSIGQSSAWDDHYLFVGEEGITLREVLLPLAKASAAFPTGRGLLYLLGENQIPQIAIAGGKWEVLPPLEPDEWSYHEAPAFETERFGYEKR